MTEKEYIEREAVIDYIDKRIPKLIASADGKHIVTVEIIRDVIERFAAADVEPVKHGQWITKHMCKNNYNYGVPYDKHYCSQCNYYLPEKSLFDYNYCPSCGAKMDGGDVDVNDT